VKVLNHLLFYQQLFLQNTLQKFHLLVTNNKNKKIVKKMFIKAVFLHNIYYLYKKIIFYRKVFFI
jgi:hypothetical protein